MLKHTVLLTVCMFFNIPTLSLKVSFVVFPTLYQAIVFLYTTDDVIAVILLPSLNRIGGLHVLYSAVIVIN